MAVRPNFYYSDPSVGNIATNLGLAIFGDQSQAAQNSYYRARAAHSDAETRLLDLRNQGYADLPGLMEGVMVTTDPVSGARRPATPAEIALRMPSVMGRFAGTQQGAGSLTEAFRVFNAAGAGQGSDSMGRAAVIASGGSPSRDFAVTSGRADEISSRDAREEDRRAFGVAGIGQAGQDRRHAATIAYETANPTYDRARGGAVDRFTRGGDAVRPGDMPVIFPPHNTSPDAVTAFAPGDPRARTDAPRLEGGSRTPTGTGGGAGASRGTVVPRESAADLAARDDIIAQRLGVEDTAALQQGMALLTPDEAREYERITADSYGATRQINSAATAGHAYLARVLRPRSTWAGLGSPVLERVDGRTAEQIRTEQQNAAPPAAATAPTVGMTPPTAGAAGAGGARRPPQLANPTDAPMTAPGGGLPQIYPDAPPAAPAAPAPAQATAPTAAPAAAAAALPAGEGRIPEFPSTPEGNAQWDNSLREARTVLQAHSNDPPERQAQIRAQVIGRLRRAGGRRQIPRDILGLPARAQ